MKEWIEELLSTINRLHQRFQEKIMPYRKKLFSHKWSYTLLKKSMLYQRRHKNKWKNTQNGIQIMIAVVLVVAMVIGGRLIYIEGRKTVDGVALNEKTKALYQGKRTVEAKRGTIYDRNGVPIAEDATSYSVYAVLDKDYIGINNEKLYVNPKDVDTIAVIFNRYLKMNISDVKKQFDNGYQKKLKQIEFGLQGKGLTLEKRKKVEKALKKEHIKGIYFESHPTRVYPNGVFASHLIGYAQNEDQDNEDKGLVGVMGIEAAFNKELSGVDGIEYYQKDVAGNPIPGTIVATKKAQEGKDIYTTLDANLEIYLESLMTQVDKKYTPESMTAVLMKADTGEILAASQRPTFNPETKEGLQNDTNSKDGAQWRNLLVQDAFEPGSVMKIFTVAAAIQSGKFNPNATFQAGSTNVDGITIRDWDYDHPKALTYAQALTHSSNVGMIHLQQALGPEWEVYLQKFGFTKTTNSGLPGEVSGTMQNGTSVDKAMTAYGQAISVTNFQMLRAYTAIANYGTMLSPRYISKIKNPNNGKVTKTKTEVVGHPISPETASEVLNIMQGTVTDKTLGTGTAYKLPNYNSSVKTGTAQIFENGAYSLVDGDYIYSVVQMAPSEHPEYVMYMTMKRPHIPESDDMTPTEVIASMTTPVMERALALDKDSSKYKKEETETGQ